MKFVTNGNQIDCVRRIARTEGESGRDLVVVSFDDNQEVIPPHAAACLTAVENKMLKDWLHERAMLTRKLDKESVEETVLDTLPALLSKANNALDELESIDFELFKRLKNNLREFDEKLNRFHSLVDDSSLELIKMQEEEVLKEKLENIKESL